MNTDMLRNPTVKATIDALQKGDRAAWSAHFERDAKLYDDGGPRSLERFTADALGHERFTSIERVSPMAWRSSAPFTPTSGATPKPTFASSSPRRERSRASIAQAR